MFFSEIRLFAKKLTWRKTANLLACYANYGFALLSRKPVLWAMPMSLSVEPTTACNLFCDECESRKPYFPRPTGEIELIFFKKIIDQFSPTLANLFLYLQGEPFLHPDFFDIVSYAARQKGIFTATSSNGHFLSPENARKTVKSGLDKLIISINATTPELHKKYTRTGNLQTVLKGVENLLAARKKLKASTPTVVLQMLVSRDSENQIGEFRKLAKQLGADQIRLETMQLTDFKNGNQWMPKNLKYSRYRKNNDGQFEIKNPLRNHCSRLWNSAVITWNGDVLPCCFDKSGRYPMGNLHTQNFRQIRNNQQFCAFRRKVLQNRKRIDICTNCTQGLRR